MAALTAITTTQAPGAASRSAITDLRLAPLGAGGGWQLYATTRWDGALTSWDISGAGLARADLRAHAGGAVLGGDPGLTVVQVAGQTHILSGGAGAGQLALSAIDSAGDLGPPMALPGTGGAVGRLTQTATLTLPNGMQAVYGGIAGADGLGHLRFTAAGALKNTRVLPDSAQTFAARISDVATAQVGTAQYLFTASSTENGITTWAVAPNGIPTPVRGLGSDDGLWVAAPAALASTMLNGHSYLVLAAAGSGSLSVMRVGGDGKLHIIDHVIDTGDSRFGGVTDMVVVAYGAQRFVIAGGADDGISVYQLLAGGRLVAVAHLADTPGLTLANISALAARARGTGLDIFAASGSETGLTRLRLDLDVEGLSQRAAPGGDVLTGGAGRDMLQGSSGGDVLSGRSGDDILRDGAGADTLTGGAGADVFVLDYDRVADVIRDFTAGTDRLDLSGFPMLRSLQQLILVPTATGFAVTYGDDLITLHSADGGPIDPDLLTGADIALGGRIPQDLPPGYSGPLRPPPDLPPRPAPDPDGRGTAGTDTLYGTAAADTLAGLAGHDTLSGLGGADLLYGGPGDDLLIGGDGADRLLGDAGHDRLVGGTGGDTLTGGDGRDLIWGGAQGDTLLGGHDSDTLWGQNGHDRLYGGAGQDDLLGQWGHDRLYGGDGPDLLEGSLGRDRLIGGAGRDTLDGGAEADRLLGGHDGDTLIGGPGNDRLYGGAGADLLEGNAGRNMLDGGPGNDRLIGSRAIDRLLGQTGHDTIYAKGGADVIGGGDGRDRIVAGAGHDILAGGAGPDRLLGGLGADRLFGGAQGDWLDGGTGADRLTGGAGADRFVFRAGVDRIRDFNPAHDRIVLDQTLWPGALGDTAITRRYAQAMGDDLVLTFGGGHSLRIEDFTDLATLPGLIDQI